MKTLWHTFLSMSRGKQIALTVLSLHFAILIGLIGHDWFTKKRIPHQRISVRTISLPRPVASTPVKQNKPIAQAPKKQKETPKKTASLPKKEKKIAPPAKKEAENLLLDEISQAISPLSAKPHKESRDLPIPTPVTFSVDTPSVNVEAPSAAEEIVAFLQTALQLPEYGDVVMKIEIGSAGNLVSCEIIDAKSQKNGEFLKKELPSLHFPCFNTNTTFTITFRNVENL